MMKDEVEEGSSASKYSNGVDRPKLLYVIVEDDDPGENVDGRLPSSRYTRAALQSTIQFMGCKPRHAFKISVRVFDALRNEPPLRVVGPACENAGGSDGLVTSEDVASTTVKFDVLPSSRKPPAKPSQRRSMVLVSREKFLDVVCEALAQYQYVGPNQRADLMLACRIRERKTSVTILLCGTSGCGKSTLSSLLASRLGITTVVSTDSIRHMMRSFVDEKTNPLLWASTYHAGEYLDPVAVMEANAKRKAKVEPEVDRSASSSSSAQPESHLESEQENGVSSKTMVVQGFKAQCEMVIDSLERLITSWEQRNESVVVEGVHLSLNFVMGLMRKHPSIIPFMIYISNEEKHLERFAVRAKYMTLDPSKNKYAKYIRNIRIIQEYLCKRADKHLVPKINNTNVDKSVAGIHATIFSCLRRRDAGEQLYDGSTNTVKVIDHEYQNQFAASSMGSKGMLQLIQRKGSSHHLMALMNVDGSVAKTWPIEKVCRSCESGASKAEPINLQFGNFGLSAFRETGETSSSSAGDGQSSKENHDFNSSRSSISSTSPRHAEVADKEAVDEAAGVFVNEEEQEDTLSDDEEFEDRDMDHEQDEEIEGSVNEGSDDDGEYNDHFEDGYWSEEQLERVEAQVYNMDMPAAPRSGAAVDSTTKGDGFGGSLVRTASGNHSGKVHHRRSNSTSPPDALSSVCGKLMHSRTKSLPVHHQVVPPTTPAR